jgi:hypothetical protein
MMHQVLRWVLVAVATAGLGGCLDMEKLVHVKADGSGFVEERILIKREALAMMQGMAKMGGQPGAETSVKLIDPEKLAAEAAAMGPGVSLVSTEALSTPEAEGYVARFAFTDINQLILDQNPKDPAAGDDAQAGGGPEAASSASEAIRFELRPGAAPVLVVHTPADTAKDPAAVSPEAKDSVLPEGPEGDMAMQMMQQMFQGMRVVVAIEVEGEIQETNAAFREGSRVTMLDIEFEQLLKDPERFRRFAASQPEGVGEVKALMKDMPGVKIEPAETVEIQFAPQ